MKKLFSLILALAMCAGVMAGCTSQNAPVVDDTPTQETLTFYHGYFHDASEWAPAAVMREIYDEFAAEHANDACVFVPTPVENGADIMNNMVAGGDFPDVIDLAGTALSAAAVSQGLVYDMKDYIDSEDLADEVGLNYTQNDVDGSIYTVHDQLLTIGYWYNEQILTDAGATLPDTWANWDDFATAMATVRDYGSADGIYAYGAGQGSTRIFNAILALSDEGKEMLSGELTAEMVSSQTFADAFTAVATMDQENGSQNTSDTANDFSADFNAGKSSVFFNGVWAAGGFGGDASFQPAIYPGNVSLCSAGSGICISSDLSEAQTALALEFVKYMTSEEVQTRIFTEVGANPCNSNLDLEAIAAASGDAVVELLAKACAQANNAETVVPTMDAVWGADINTIISTKLQESTVSGAVIADKLAEVQAELTAILA